MRVGFIPLLDFAARCNARFARWYLFREVRKQRRRVARAKWLLEIEQRYMAVAITRYKWAARKKEI